MVRGLLAALASVCAVATSAGAKVTIDSMRHDIQQITMSNFDGVISKFRDQAAASLWFFKEDNKADLGLLDEYNKVAKELKGMAKICAISCTEWPIFCDKQGVKETPTIMVYPTNPMPAFKYDGKMDSKSITSKVSRFIPDFTTKLTKDNVDKWAATDMSKPKVIVFSNKKTPPTLLKALSSDTVFRRTIHFGFVAAEEEKDIVQKYKIKTFPAVVMQRGGKGEIKEPFKGDMSYSALKDWINPYSESGMGDKLSGPGGKDKEEVFEEADLSPIPEVTFKNQKSLCFKGEGLCVIYLREGKLSKEEEGGLVSLSNKFTSQLSDRGANFKWMWMDVAVETEFKELFKPSQLPSAVVFNPHKRLRYTLLDHGEENQIKGDVASIKTLLDKVLGGDARFKVVPGQKLPAFAARQAAAAGKPEL